jgi:lambda repressor-like predicted transcriptional regulator
METTTRTDSRSKDILSTLRKQVSTLASQSEDEALLADILAMLNGIKRPCTYTAEEFAGVLKESDEDYKAGRYVSNEELFARYGL